MTPVIEGWPDLICTPIPCGLVSLRDMITHEIFTVTHALWLLRYEERAIQLWIDKGIAPSMGQPNNVQFVPDGYKLHLKRVGEHAEHVAQNLEMEAVTDRLEIFNRKISMPISLTEVVAELMVIRETIETALKNRYFYYYPMDKAKVVVQCLRLWQKVIEAFPQTKAEIECAADLYALNHNTASVFHSMRVAEHGLRALAKERKLIIGRNKPVEWATWKEVIKRLNAEIIAIENKSPGSPRDRALEFYSGAVADLNGFKNEYRDMVMHVRSEYDHLQSLRAYQRVHAFMERIAEKIDHKHHRIRWGLK